MENEKIHALDNFVTRELRWNCLISGISYSTPLLSALPFSPDVEDLRNIEGPMVHGPVMAKLPISANLDL